jgi:hypothetical protein
MRKLLLSHKEATGLGVNTLTLLPHELEQIYKFVRENPKDKDDY